MKTFNLKVTEKVMLVEIYQVEAESEQEAIDRYCEDLAGGINPVDSWTEDIRADMKEDVVIYNPTN